MIMLVTSASWLDSTSDSLFSCYVDVKDHCSIILILPITKVIGLVGQFVLLSFQSYLHNL